MYVVGTRSWRVRMYEKWFDVVADVPIARPYVIRYVWMGEIPVSTGKSHILS